ncbi:MAG: AraC family transcriptional regulator [Solobacterium sp.]|jgi:YesN/AraC family two-component response regulator|nr:AraC family transcriptional regulator [Solobacterium sp.]MCH4222501.1 AraC family transcriptional regulator [Solobacterium sp.]MCH4265456.1 AraC family transcriptional regulator [Solobacterium sp.]
MNLDEKLDLFWNMIACKYPIYHSQYDSDFQLADSNCAAIQLWNKLFSNSGSFAYIRKYFDANRMPLVMSDQMGIMWGVVFNPSTQCFYMLGPVLAVECSVQEIGNSLREIIEAYEQDNDERVTLNFRNRLTAALNDLPVVPMTDLCNDMIMMHYAVTGETVSRSDVSFQKEIFVHQTAQDWDHTQTDRYRTWRAEQALLRMVREGDLNYKVVLNNAANISRGVPVHSKDPIRQAKISAETFATLCTRAAIDGGLMPEQAYSTGDLYIQQIENCKILSDIPPINHTMYEDFIARVHKCHQNQNISKQVQSCMDYIDLHPEEKITITDMASRVGYAEYYLSRKFRSEVGCSIHDYIKISKVKRAKILLITTQDSIFQIAERLNFCSRSYFADEFKKYAGMPPAEYREKNARI